MSHVTRMVGTYGALAVVIVAIATATALFAQPARTPSYRGSLPVLVSIDVPDRAGTASSDIQAELDGAVATVQSWVADPAVAKQALGASAAGSVTELAEAYEVVPAAVGSSAFRVERAGSDAAAVRSELEALARSLEARASASGVGSSAAITVDFPGDIVTAEEAKGLPLAPLAGFAAGLVLAAVMIAFLERNRSER